MRPASGPAPLRPSAIARVFDYWTDFSFTVEHVLYDEDWAMAYGTFAATARKRPASES